MISLTGIKREDFALDEIESVTLTTGNTRNSARIELRKKSGEKIWMATYFSRNSIASIVVEEIRALLARRPKSSIESSSRSEEPASSRFEQGAEPDTSW